MSGIPGNSIHEEGAVFGSFYLLWSVFMASSAFILIYSLVKNIRNTSGLKRGKITTIVVLFIVSIISLGVTFSSLAISSISFRQLEVKQLKLIFLPEREWTRLDPELQLVEAAGELAD
jgi:glucan phosphoethanolaminetransferase (alkaline phosphatase superfamily)